MSSIKRKSAEEPAVEPLPPQKHLKEQHTNINYNSNSINNSVIETLDRISCLHDVSYPEGYVPPPRPNSSSSVQSDAKPAKEFPFTLDPFQSEAIKCLDKGESVMVMPRKEMFYKKIFNGDVKAKASTLFKRKPTLKKKAKELQTLCGIKVFMVCVDPDGTVDRGNMWPETEPEAKELIEEYKGLEKKDKVEVQLEDFFSTKLKKLEKKLEKKRKSVINDEVGNFLSLVSKRLDGLQGEELLSEVNEVLVPMLNKFKSRAEFLRNRGNTRFVDCTNAQSSNPYSGCGGFSGSGMEYYNCINDMVPGDIDSLVPNYYYPNYTVGMSSAVDLGLIDNIGANYIDQGSLGWINIGDNYVNHGDLGTITSGFRGNYSHYNNVGVNQ